MELLAYIDTIDDLRWIPSVGHPVLDSSQITRQIESCSILFLEDTRWYLGLLWEYDTDTPILILRCDSLLDQLADDILHTPLEICIVFVVRTRERESLIEALTDVVGGFHI